MKVRWFSIFIVLFLTSFIKASSMTTSSLYVNPEGLIAYYPFDQCTGTSATDRGDWGLNGVLNGGVNITWQVGKYGCGINFTGVNAKVNVTNNAIMINPTSAITITAWVYSTTVSGEHPFLRKETNEYNLELSGNKFRFELWNSSGVIDLYSNTAYSTNTQYHIAGVLSGGTMTIYVNGVADGTTTFVGVIQNDGANQPLDIGFGAGSWWSGTIDEVKIWNRALSAQEIYVDYLGTYANIEAYYQSLTTSNITSAQNNILGNMSGNFSAIQTNFTTIQTNFSTIQTNMSTIITNIATLQSLMGANFTYTNGQITLVLGNQTYILNNESSILDGVYSINDTVKASWSYENRTDEIASWVWSCPINSQDCYDSLSNPNGLVGLIWSWSGRNVQVDNYDELAYMVWDNSTAPDRTLTETSCNMNITVNQTNSSETYNYTYNNTEVYNNTYNYSYNYTIGGTNITYNYTSDFNISTEMKKELSKGIAFYLPTYEEQYSATFDAFMHPVVFGYVLPFPIQFLFFLAIFNITCMMLGIYVSFKLFGRYLR
jgi:hypothetical protein